MAGTSKNARIVSGTHKFSCSCGGEVKMGSVFSSGRMKYFASCDKCHRKERRPRDFT